jgi:4-amino-4-deoxy-L-arabinose transferase-like glycosyltransferase
MDRRSALVFAMCALPRLLAGFLFPPRTSGYYDELATSLLTTGTLGFDSVPSTYIEPLYPLFLAGARLVTGHSVELAIVLQIGVASFGGVLFYRLASRLANPRTGFCAAVFYALYPYLVRQSVARLEITLCATLAIAAALSLTRVERTRDAIASGALLGLLMLTRTSFVVAALGAAAWLAWQGRPSTRLGAGPATSLGTGRRLGAVLLLTALLVEGPWLVRNMRVDGAPLPSRIGENLYVSTSDYAAMLPLHDIDLFVPLALADVSAEVERMPPSRQERGTDDAMLKRGLAFVRDHPGRVLWLKARNALYLLSPQLLPREAKSAETFAARDGGTLRIVNAARRPWIGEAAHAAAQSVLLVLAAIGVARRGIRGRDAPLLIMLAAQAAVCVVFFPTTRLMAPVMFVPMFYAAAGLNRASRIAHRASSTGSSGAAPPRP